MISPSGILQGKILIVDDKDANILLLEQMLRGAGYAAITSTMDPGQVCELHRQNGYALILLDLEMPGMNGFQVMDDLKLIESDGYLPVLVITAEPGHKLRALKAGAKDFISKPFDVDEVLMRVHNMLEVRLLHNAASDQRRLLESQAGNDPLTGLANRRLLAERMAMVLAHARRKKRAMAVLYMDLDGFKQINDTYGHGAGDILLKRVAERLTGMARKEDTVARLGGDEFLIMLSEVIGSDCAAIVATKVIEAVSRPFDIDGHAVHMTISVGISVYPIHGEDAETLIKNADLALYQAKHAGKNTFRISEQTLDSRDAPTPWRAKCP